MPDPIPRQHLVLIVLLALALAGAILLATELR